MPLDEADYRLSMRISRRRQDRQEVHRLRSLLVHRLRQATKAVFRVALSGAGNGIYCEGCGRWAGPLSTPPPMFTCPRCSRRFEVEFVVYSETKIGSPE